MRIHSIPSHFSGLSNEEKLILKLMIVNLSQNLENEALSNQLHDGRQGPSAHLSAKQARTMRKIKQTIEGLEEGVK
jgi:hypothetical protein